MNTVQTGRNGLHGSRISKRRMNGSLDIRLQLIGSFGIPQLRLDVIQSLFEFRLEKQGCLKPIPVEGHDDGSECG